MRVVHCITGLLGDGAQRMLLRLACQLQEKGVENFVVSLSKRESLALTFEKNGIPVFSMGMTKSYRDVRILLECRKLVHDIAPNVLQGWMYHGNIIASLLRATLRGRMPVVWNIRRGMDDYAERSLLTRLAIKVSARLSPLADKVIYCTPESCLQHQDFGFSRTNGVKIGNGFDLTKFAPCAETRRIVRAKYGITDREVVIGNVGRNDSAKGRPYLLRAFADIRQLAPRTRLLLVGRDMDDGNAELRRQLVSLGIAARVTLVGEYAPICELYTAMDLLCSSSVAEGFPNVVAEGMSSGLSCVGTDTGKTRDLLDGVGVVVPPRSSATLAQALIEMCNESAEKRRARGELARAKIEREYPLSRIVDEYSSLYSALANTVAYRGPKAESDVRSSSILGVLPPG